MDGNVPPALEQSHASLQGFAQHGPTWWPCATFFVLAGLDANGEADGGGAEVCRACVTKVAVDALYAVQEGDFGYSQVVQFNRQPGQQKTAVGICGPAAGYDLWGVTDPPQDSDACCADCGQRLVKPS